MSSSKIRRRSSAHRAGVAEVFVGSDRARPLFEHVNEPLAEALETLRGAPGCNVRVHLTTDSATSRTSSLSE